MRSFVRFTLVLSLACAALCVRAAVEVRETSLSNIVAFARSSTTNRLWFTVSGTVVTLLEPGASIVLRDGTAQATLHNPNQLACSPGDKVRISGITSPGKRPVESSLSARAIRILGHGQPPPPRSIRLADVDDTKTSDPVRTRGFIVDAKTDEIDPRWIYLVLKDGRAAVYVTVPANPELRENFRALVEARAEITGFIAGNASGQRRFFGRHISLPSAADLRILTPAPRDVFAAKPLEDIDALNPADVRALMRRRVTGTVLAAWGGSKFLLRDDRRRILRIELDEAGALPKAGERVEAVGFPETDLYHLNLTRSVFRPAPGPAESPDAPKSVRPEEILLDASGNLRIETHYHGQAIRVRGIVRTRPSPENPQQRFELDCGRLQIPVDVSADPSVLDAAPIGSTVEAAGICLMEAPNWQTSVELPTLDGFCVVIRTPDDITVLERPSWWTTGRLTAVIGSLLAALLGVFVWNRALSRLIVRRGRQLMREELARKSAELRIAERTRLAVDLHDSLSQNLSGLACQITAVRKTLDPASAAAAKLDVAEHMLFSSRTELKRCLSDLRSNLLDCRNMSEAITRTVAPCLGDAALVVRFNVARSRFDDPTAHSILCIVRELAANAVRHGRAQQVKVAGTVDGDQILFSVRDDGSGFDVARHAGIEDGHFGLTGIRERVAHLDGEFVLESTPGRGTFARIRFPLAQSFQKQ